MRRESVIVVDLGLSKSGEVSIVLLASSSSNGTH